MCKQEPTHLTIDPERKVRIGVGFRDCLVGRRSPLASEGKLGIPIPLENLMDLVEAC